MIDVTLIGTGALQPLPGRALASAAFTLSGHSLLLDCGEGTQSAAKAAGISLLKIAAVALTHYHGDHVFGLPGLMQSMNIAQRTEPLYILGPDGLEDALSPILALCPNLGYEIRLLHLPQEGLSLHTLSPAWPLQARLTAFPTRHRVESQGYCLSLSRSGKFLPENALALGVPVSLWKALQQGQPVETEGLIIHPDQVMEQPRRGLTVVYTGDTAPCPAVTEAAKGVDLLICEATYGTDELLEYGMEYGHSTFLQAAEMARQANPRALWLTHFSPRIDDPNDFLASAAALFPAAVCGQDGMKTTLVFDQE
ncbi:MAG: ribonuclease Z [Clostridiales bacterium]|nr:ribonuclease Z [Clostridiales bacterium]